MKTGLTRCVGLFHYFAFAKNWQKYRLLPLFSFRMTKGFMTNIVRFVWWGD